MHTKESLSSQISALGIRPNGTLLIHSSMKAVGECDGGADTVIDTFLDYMKDGLLTLPTHSWSDNNLKDGIYDPLTEPACVGILPNIFRTRPNVIRSLHPTHSIAAAGSDAYEFIQGEEFVITPCGINGSYRKLYERGAQILFLGCTLKSNTIIHGVEEWNDVPDRLTPEKIPVTMRRHNGEFFKHATYRHHSSAGNISLNYDILEPVLLQTGIAKTGTIGDAFCYLVDCRSMCDLVSTFLQKKPMLFNTREEIPREWY
jgi:aminoglycoside 3-N-acetyltransferase